jgi:hypothetical protein
MTTNDADRRLTAWLTDAAPAREPEHLLSAVLEETARTPRRPAWRITGRWFDVSLSAGRLASVLTPPWRLIALAAILVLAIAGAILVAGARRAAPPPPFGPARNGDVVYSDVGDLYARTSPIGPARPLVVGPAPDAAPAFSRDGTHVAFLRGEGAAGSEFDRTGLWVAGAGGEAPRRLGDPFPGEVTGFDWSPDGATIAVGWTQQGGSPHVALVTVADGARRAVASDLGAAMNPRWHPGGEQLLVRAHVAAGDADTGPPLWGLYLVALDGHIVNRLGLHTGLEDPDYRANWDDYFNRPSWSPDGTRIAFDTLEYPTVASDTDPGWRVHVATVDSRGLVTDEQTLNTTPAADDDFDATWLPDGSGLVLHRIEEGVHDVVVVRLGNVPSELVLGPHLDNLDLSFVVSPDGREVLAWDRASRHTWRMDPATGSLEALDGTIDDAATWQRTGE